MALVLTCAKCAQRLSIPDEMRGKQVRCPKCREVYTVDRKAAKTGPTAASPRPAVRSPGQAAPAVSRPPQSPGAAKQRTLRCPQCSVQMRLPSQSAATTFQCPKCAAKLTVGASRAGTPKTGAPKTGPPSATPRPAASQPSAPRAPTAPQAAPTAPSDDSIFGSLPSSSAAPYSPSGAARSSPAGQNPYAASASSPRSAPAFSAKGRAGKSSLLWQGLMIAVPNGLSMLFLIFLVAAAFAVDDSKSFSNETGSLIVMAVISVYYLLVVAGAIGMIKGAPRWLSTTICIASLLPAIPLFVPCFGFFLYPVVLGGAVWGLISLFGGAPSLAGGGYSPSAASPAANYHAASGPLAQAQREANQKKSSSGESGSTAAAVACVFGGVVCTGISIALIVLLCLVMAGQLEVETRRPFKAIAGVIFFGSTGFSFLAKGIMHFQNRC
ncbi:hypothetical protein [Allorhodopirellula solitaria]|uniref:Uncharacterized protein n=1 Tax=Allorhodopirellula solitaria TaxID=2527987 RepID=A0A5C5X979_9BACT|nr:hypothetical protein [Allorhodopirellula solitaria]TWT59269.1 hypothetical protein CA85_39650 [Allorhodopirellula solitaria]